MCGYTRCAGSCDSSELADGARDFRDVYYFAKKGRGGSVLDLASALC